MGCAFSRKRSRLKRFVFSITIILSTLLAVVAIWTSLRFAGREPRWMQQDFRIPLLFVYFVHGSLECPVEVG